MRNVLFVVVDCLRADRCWGNQRTCKVPTIDKLVQDSTVFTQALSITSYTVSSFASILSGTYPFIHSLRGIFGQSKLNPQCDTLAEIFRDNGYNTYAEVTGPLLGMLGLDRGFSHYSHREDKFTLYSDWGKRFIRELRNKKYREPWFIFLHLWEIHDPPRIVLKEFDNDKFGNTIYDRSLSSLDSKLKEIFDIIDDDTIVVFTGDHGEGINSQSLDSLLKLYHFVGSRLSFLKNSKTLIRLREVIKTKLKVISKSKDDITSNLSYEYPHGVSLFDYNHKVPLIIKGKGIFKENEIIKSQVSHLDIFPTLLDLLELKHNELIFAKGRSLLSCNLLDDDFSLYLELAGSHIPKEDWLFGIRTTRYKYINAPFNHQIKDTLYDLEIDNTEKQNIIDQEPDIAKNFRQQLEKIIGEFKQDESQQENLTNDESEILKKHLKSLGYL